MTDFEKYLGEWLLNSGEDCCSRCTFQPLSDKELLCDNLKDKQGLDNEVCLRGLREYFGAHGSN